DYYCSSYAGSNTYVLF
nr:immunoglobulin light chain junction region [Macaca mulatta]MOX78003.1 immunoglobulin light chain junction region [Macaca mulatta]MOX79412.1 immunoglobulin light chain junction region [Macaca mulatta]MOX79593.1 immunoglobulin light chain junction region [Macaca mulatta]MOX80186.1 immunoglobulin light chain junction region [Macaca mulatta]